MQELGYTINSIIQLIVIIIKDLEIHFIYTMSGRLDKAVVKCSLVTGFDFRPKADKFVEGICSQRALSYTLWGV